MCHRSARSGPVRTGASARPTTCSASCSTAIRTCGASSSRNRSLATRCGNLSFHHAATRAEADDAVPVGPFGIDPAIWAPLRLVIAVLLAVGLVFNGALAQIYLERKIQAVIQDRLRPLHTGPWGLLQTFADAIKLLGQGDIRARLTDKSVFLAPPSIAV